MKNHVMFVSLLLVVTSVVCQQPTFSAVDRCSLPAVTGQCRAYIRSFYFNTETQKCERFVYGGCGGNANRFFSQLECQRSCSCSLPPDSGMCYAAFPRWFYDSRHRTCRLFIYGGCGGNDNNFEGYSECSRICSKPSVNSLGNDIFGQQTNQNSGSSDTWWRWYIDNLSRNSWSRKLGTLW